MGTIKGCFLLIAAIQVFSQNVDLVTVKYTDYNYTDSGKCTLIQDDPNKVKNAFVIGANSLMIIHNSPTRLWSNATGTTRKPAAIQPPTISLKHNTQNS